MGEDFGVHTFRSGMSNRFNTALAAVADAGGPSDWGQWQRCAAVLLVGQPLGADDWNNQAGHQAWFDLHQSTQGIWSKLGDFVPSNAVGLKSDFTRWRSGERRALSLPMKRQLLAPIRGFLRDNDDLFSVWWLEGDEGTTLVRGSAWSDGAFKIEDRIVPEGEGGPHIKDRLIAREMRDQQLGAGWPDDLTAAPAWVIRWESECHARNREAELRREAGPEVDIRVARGDLSECIKIARRSVQPYLDRYFSDENKAAGGKQ